MCTKPLLTCVLLGAVVSSVSANPADPFLWPYNQPTGTTFDPAPIAQAWNEWKSAQVTAVNAGGNGRLRVLGGVNNTTTVSEGQGYGILFASIFDDQATLDGLWLFTSDHLNGQGLMDWHIGNPGQRLGTGAATDGDVDIALGLVNACIKVRRGSWPSSPRGVGYCSQAAEMIDAVYQFEVDKPGGSPPSGLQNNQGNELLPGDSWSLAVDFPQGIVNLSYFAPGYFTVFGKFTNNEAAWAAVKDRNYALVDLAQAAGGNCSRLVPNWIRYDGGAQWVPWQPNNYSWWSYDAARLAWRVAVDRVWYRTNQSLETMNEIGSFFSSAGLSNIGEHSMNGQRTGSGPWPFFVANAGVAIWAADRLTPVSCGAATGSLRETPESAYNRVLATKDTPDSYYGNAWRLFALLVMSGNFPNFFELAGGDASQPPPAPSPEPPATAPPPPVPPSSTSAACDVQYSIINRWNDGFHANITITNRGGQPVSGYALQWSFAGGEQFASGWNADYAQRGTSMTASNTAGHWNGTIAQGASVVFGFIGRGNPQQPGGFRLNEMQCRS